MNAAQITRTSRTNFALAFAGLGRSRRHALQALYAFCRIVDDIVDETGDPDVARAELDVWRSALGRFPNPSASDPPPAHELARACSEFPVRVPDLLRIVDGVQMDLDRNRYRTFGDLLTYCDGVASAVGLASMAVFGGERERTSTYAYATGRALQLTNILRDVGEDAGLNRIYLPGEDLERFGYGERDVLDSVYDDRFVRLMEFEKERAESFFRASEAALPEEERRGFPAAELMRKLYQGLLRRIEARRYRVFGPRIRLSKPKKLGIALSVWIPHFLRRAAGAD